MLVCLAAKIKKKNNKFILDLSFSQKVHECFNMVKHIVFSFFFFFSFLFLFIIIIIILDNIPLIW